MADSVVVGMDISIEGAIIAAQRNTANNLVCIWYSRASDVSSDPTPQLPTQAAEGACVRAPEHTSVEERGRCYSNIRETLYNASEQLFSREGRI